MIDIEAAGVAARDEMRRMFEADVWDPPVGYHHHEAERWRDEITDMIGAGGLGWTWEGRYEGDGSFEWCLAAAAKAWRKAGLRPADALHFWASTIRVDRWARYRPWEGHANPAPTGDGAHRMIIDLDENSRSARFPDGSLPRAGDIALGGFAPKAAPKGVGKIFLSCGIHGMIVDAYDEATCVFLTLEGNAHGTGPDGKERQGMVRGVRHLGGFARGAFHVRRVIRPSPLDLVG